jgi:hypothetical protein
LVEAGVLASTMTFNSVDTAALVACWRRPIDCPGAAGGTVGLLELGLFLPSQQRSCPNTCRPGSLLVVPVREQCGNRLLHFAAEF